MRLPLLCAISGLLLPLASVDAGTLWTVGANAAGQLGDGTTTNASKPVEIRDDVTAVAAGHDHSLFLTADGQAWAVGFNLHGQLGDGTTDNRSTPVAVASDVAAIAAGNFHSAFIKNDHSLWMAGWNIQGQLGDGTTEDRTTPVQVATDVVAVACGAQHTLFLKIDGSVWAMGANGFGQLGDTTNDNRAEPVQVMTGVAAIAAGSWHSLFLKTDGTLWASGANEHGQLGDTTTDDRNAPVQIADNVTAMAAGNYHTIFVKNDGTLWAAGENGLAQLGNGTTKDTATPVQVADDAATVTAGGWSSFYRDADGTLFAFGSNTFGQLGDGTTSPRGLPEPVGGAVVAVSAGENHSLWIFDDVPLGIGEAPASQTVSAGDPVIFSTTIAGAPNATATYQWQYNGVDIPDATNVFYVVPNAQVFNAGDYAVKVTLEGNTITSAAATLTVEQPDTTGSRLTNLSSRGQVLTGDSLMIPSFVIAGTGNQKMLIRAAGPGLAGFGVSGTLADPQIVLQRQDATDTVDVANNDNWGSNANVTDITETAKDVGAFAFNPSSKDAALLSDLQPGQYTVATTGVSNATGVALVEIYDAAESSTSAFLSNIATRAAVGTGGNILIVGFAIDEKPMTLLIRGVGPTLASLDVSGVLTDPELTVFSGTTRLFSNDDWGDVANSAQIEEIAEEVGAFALPAGSKDAALVVTLKPGSYTVQLSGKDDGTGVGLIEIYRVP